MTLDKISCAGIEGDCKESLRDSFAFTFDDDSARDTYFQNKLTQLENQNNIQTLIFVGTSTLKYAVWNGAHHPSAYDANGWQELPIATLPNGDIHYWPNDTDNLAMRARRDSSTGYLYFERLISGSWVEKFRISDSVTVDAIKLIATQDMPVVDEDDELGLATIVVKDAEHGDARVLRPYFMDKDHNHFPLVAAYTDTPSGGARLRVPQNFDAALADPDGTPVEYKDVILEDDHDAVVAAITNGGQKLPATAVDPDPQVAANKSEIERIKTDTSGSGLPIFSWYDRGVPALPTDQQKAYYIHIRVLPDSAQSIQIPANTPEDCIFSVENNDRNDYVTIRAAAGETISGATTYQAQPDTLSLFVKSGSNYDLAYGGVFPNSMDSLKSSVEVLLTGQLHTITDIQGQLKDYLHTFNQIEQHFSDKLFTRADGLPTAQEIVNSMESDPGNPKLPAGVISDLAEVRKYTITNGTAVQIAVDATIVMLDYDGPDSVQQTIQNIINVREGSLLVVHVHSGSPSDTPVITLHAGASGQTIEGNESYDVDVNMWVMFAADKKANNWVELSAIDMSPAGPATSTGIEIDDGTTDAADIRKLKIKGAKLTEIPNSGGMGANEAEMTTGLNWHMMAPDQQFGSALATEVIIVPPLSTFVDPDQTGAEAVRLEIEHDAFEPMHKPSFLAYLKDSVDVVGKIPQGYENTAGSHHKGAIWFDDIIVPAGAYIETKMAEKSYGIQEADELDPNVTGGTDYLIAARIHMRGKAPSSGFVRLYLYNTSIDPFSPSGYLLDKAGNPMAVERHYKFDEELGVLDIIGVVNAKGLQEFTTHVVDSFSDDIVELTDRTEGASGIMIQALSSEEKTGLGLLQFENDTQQNIEFSAHYLGADRMSIGYMTSRPESVVSYTAGTNWDSVDGYRLINPNGIKLGVVDGRIHIQDDGVHICDFNFGKVFTAEEAQMLRGKDVDVTVTVVDKDAGFNVGLMKWTGKPDEYTHEIFTTRDGGGSPEFQTGWSLADSLFISEDVVAGDHTLSKTFVVPSDANNYAFIIYPVQAQDPITLKLKQFKADVNPAFVGYALHAPELLNEMHLIESDEHASFVQDTQGYASLRYTINPSPTGLPMPAGIKKSGNAPVTLDATVNQVSGSSARGGEGALKFDNDGNARIVTSLLLWNEQGTDNTATFWWAEVSSDGSTYTKLPDSEFSFTVPANSKGSLHRFVYRHDFEANDRIALRASANKADGAFLQCVSNSKPSVDIDIEFKELVAGSGDDPELVSGPWERKLVSDFRIVPFSGVNMPTYKFPVDIPADVEIACVVVESSTGMGETGVEYNRDDANGELTVQVGSITDGKIKITFRG